MSIQWLIRRVAELTGSLHRSGAGRVWGSDEVNVEGWKPLKRLPGHESGTSPLNNLRSRLIFSPCPFVL